MRHADPKMTAAAVVTSPADIALSTETAIRTSARAARRHSALVRLMRTGLLLAMLGVGVNVGRGVVAASLAPPVTAPAAQLDEDVRMVNPRFTGRDAAGVPYELTADTALRRQSDAGRTELDKPRLNYVDGDASDGSMVLADTGIYDRGEGTLDLFGDVRFESASGYAFTTTHARVFVDDGRIVGDEPVTGSGPIGAVQAQSFEIFDSGGRVVFRQSVEARLTEARRAPPALREGEPSEEGYR